MKKSLMPVVAIVMIGLLSGCGNVDEGRVEVPKIEIIIDEQTGNGQLGSEVSEGEISENGQSESEQSGNGQSDGAQSSGETLNIEESAETQFSFADIADRTFYFSSGAGGWWTELNINADGSFEGVYSDLDMGDRSDSYPNGTLYLCEFSGMFGDVEKVGEYTYKIRLMSIEYAKTPEEEEIIDETRYIYSTAYGLDGSEEFYIYLPGIKMDELPESYREWVGIGYYSLEFDSWEELPYYGLYNINTGDGFSSYVDEKETQFSFGDITDKTFYLSGTGTWNTHLHINDDGSFEGEHIAVNRGTAYISEAHPGGIADYCEFSGAFGDLEKVDAYTYKMKLISIEYARTLGEEKLIDDTLYIYSTAYGLDGGEEFYIYLPGAKWDNLPESYKQFVGYYSWSPYMESEPTNLEDYGLYNINGGFGFSSYKYNEEDYAHYF
ncbi:MAG: hypothetical protein NC313_01365 [Butyrivibrio sp.]|nr:hypothetical protein [Butyrivibrio sp.]